MISDTYRPSIFKKIEKRKFQELRRYKIVIKRANMTNFDLGKKATGRHQAPGAVGTIFLGTNVD